MKRSLLFLGLFVLLLTMPVSASDAPGHSAGAMILIHAPSGQVLCEHNADAELPMASTTKLMTALIVAERLCLQDECPIRAEWTGIEGSSMYLKAGECYTVQELLQGLLLASGNDAAAALASLTAGDVPAFAALMNERAAELGMDHTHFENPHGLPAVGHYSTARDMAVLMSRVMQVPALREIMALRGVSIHNIYYVNHNKLLWDNNGVDAGKTGYTKAAGRCLVTHASVDGLSLVCVTLSDPADWEDHRAFYRWAGSRFRTFSIPVGEIEAHIPLIGGDVPEALAAAGEGVELCLPRTADLTQELFLPPFVFAPVGGEIPVGELRLYADGVKAAEIPLVLVGSRDDTAFAGQDMSPVLY